MGMVELRYRNKWGEICDQDWDIKGARVVCRTLGYPDAIRYTFGDWFGRGTGFFWLNKVRCDGTEDSLELCARSNWGDVKCRSSQVAGVPVAVRLRSGVQTWEGRVEVRRSYGDDIERWGSVCDDGFGLVEGNVVCRSLGYGTARRVFHDAWYGQSTGKVYMDDVECSGKEKDISECQHKMEWQGNCNHFEDVSLICNAPKLFGHKMRLAGGYNRFEGRVEIFMNNRWGTVCGDTWEMDEATVVCRQQGVGFAKEAVTDWFGRGTGYFWLDDLKCNGTEDSLDECPRKPWGETNCQAKNMAGVVCKQHEKDLIIKPKTRGVS
ncbi:predicted protein [Nematostella vectensis]|uniref:SRCR domain-containing protein n=1 Tax=Nematostella vectensis TaxID=45351 RepID=A7SEY1_NEMVE|nr:predicted protein [Nematostella vectensis]|eukprot:XP_001629779.1 predicted protein [Nematostella vectensis]